MHLSFVRPEMWEGWADAGYLIKVSIPTLTHVTFKFMNIEHWFQYDHIDCRIAVIVDSQMIAKSYAFL